MSSLTFETISDGPMLLGECPLWHPLEARLYWIDITARNVHCFDPVTRLRQQWLLPSEPGCIAWREGGGLIVAMRSGVALLNTVDGSLRLLLPAPYDTEKFRFNDGRCDAAGRLWVGTLVDARDSASGRLYCIDHGRIREFAHPVTVSNGVAFSLDGKTLYHADTSAHRIMAYEFDLTSGLPGTGRIFKIFSDFRDSHYGGRPDGATIDSEGAYWAAMYEGGSLLRLAQDGSLLEKITLPITCPTMLAFGGADLKTLFITSVRQKRTEEEIRRLPLSGYVLAARVSVAGRAEHGYLD